MNPKRWQQVEQVYQSAVDLEKAERPAFLAVACENDDDLKREVESLLDEENSSVIVDRPAWEAAAELLDAEPELATGTQLGPYRIEAPIGAGGMGDVYRAVDTRLDRAVALKVSKVQFSERFEREARAVASLNHPNICTLHDVGPNYLVMELVDGPTLADRIAQGPLPLDETLAIVRQVAAALDAAHKAGIVHRDVKPGNVKIRPDGTVKVLDFGLAKVGTPAEEDTSVVGTAAYVSPEQARGKPVDKRTDIWAFGVVVYEIVTGRQPFTCETRAATLEAVINRQPDMAAVPERVRRLLRSCLEKDPDHRLRDIGDAELLLEAVPVPLLARRSPLGWAVASILLVAFAATLFLTNRNASPRPAEPVRFEIPFPEDVTFGPPAFSISPDGSQLAFVAAGSDGIRRVWIRRLDALKAKPIAGSESTRTGFRHVPIWSPDSRYVAFDGGGTLKKIDLSNGLVQTLCDVNGYIAGGSWNQDGVIIFGIDTAGHGLMRVSSSGGKPSLITKGVYPGHEILPIFLPDGRHFLFMLADAASEGIYTGSIDLSPEQQPSERLIDSDSGPFYIDGYLVFTRNETVLAQSFDLDRVQVSGQAVPIAEDVGAAARVGLISVSRNALVYMTYGRNRQFTWFDRQGQILGRVERHGELAKWVPNLYVTNTAISPDGTRVLFTRGTRRRESATWVADLATGVGVQLSFLPGIEEHPIWSPDGKEVAFTNIADQGGYSYYKSSTGDGKEEPLFTPARRGRIMDWSADGNWALFRDAGASEVWLERVRGGSGQRVTLKDEEYRFPVMSPDQKWIAYVSDESGKDEIYVAPLIGSSQPQGKWKISSDGGTRVHWRRDGKELFYMTPMGTLMSVEIDADPVFKSTPPRALFRTESDPAGWDVSADGQRFLVAVPDQAPVNPFVVLLNWESILQR